MRVARELLSPEALIVGVDVAPAMLAVARTVDGTIDWREGNATALPVSAMERFSLLTCHQGLQFVGDKPAAVREMRRVIAPGGRVGIATWRSLQDNPGILEAETRLPNGTSVGLLIRATVLERPKA